MDGARRDNTRFKNIVSETVLRVKYVAKEYLAECKRVLPVFGYWILCAHGIIYIRFGQLLRYSLAQLSFIICFFYGRKARPAFQMLPFMGCSRRQQYLNFYNNNLISLLIIILQHMQIYIKSSSLNEC